MTISRIRLSLSLFVLFSHLNAQNTEDLISYKYRVYLKDKNNSPFTLDHPEAFLSEKSIERRKKQGIHLSENDLPVNPSYLKELSSNKGVTILHASKWFNSVVIETQDTQLIKDVRRLPFVVQTKLVAVKENKIQTYNSSEDSLMIFLREINAALSKLQQKEEVSSKSPYGAANRQIEMLNGIALHRAGFKGKGKTIAVLDAGFKNANENKCFEHLFSSSRVLGTRDFVAGGIEVFEDDSHGAEVLSVMAAHIPGKYQGIAPEASYWLIRTEDAGSEYLIEEDNWVSGAEFADSVGAEIINSSLGYTTFDDASTSHQYNDMNGSTTFITRGADIACSKGILVVNSAGNSGNDSWNYVGAPADADSVMSVGAVDPDKTCASFSSQGPTFDGRIKPNISALGKDIMVVNPDGEIESSNGTSFSSPVMAAMATCLWQAHPEAGSMQILKAIEQSADQCLQPDHLKGFGIPDIMKAHQILSQTKVRSLSGDSIVGLYINPFIEGITLEFFSAKDQQIRLSVLKKNGRPIIEEHHKVKSLANNLIQLRKIKKLKKGSYLVEIITEQNKISRQLIKG